MGGPRAGRPHDERYDRADEYLDLCCQLWESWDDSPWSEYLNMATQDEFVVTPAEERVQLNTGRSGQCWLGRTWLRSR